MPIISNNIDDTKHASTTVAAVAAISRCANEPKDDDLQNYAAKRKP